MTKKTKKPKTTPVAVRDFRVTGVGGSVVLVELLSATARAWVEENVQEPMWLGGFLAVEARYVAPLVEGMAESGLVADGLVTRSLARGVS